MAAAFDPFTRPDLLSDTHRARCIAELASVIDGTRYDDRPGWWNGIDKAGKEVPILERKPCIRYRLAEAAVKQVVRFLFGDKRFPRVSVEESEEVKLEGYPNLTAEQAKVLTAWFASLIEAANLPHNVAQVATKAIGCKTAVVVLQADRGNYILELPEPHHCFALFADDDPKHEVIKLLWCYEFDKEVADPTGKPVLERHFFRREWDTSSVYVYQDVKKEIGRVPEWGAPTVTPHGLSFCPVLWIRNESEACAHHLDGASIIEGLEDEFEALDMTLSRRHQGVVVLGAPQLVESAEELEQGPDASGRPASDEASYVGGHGKVAKGRARRTGPDYVWQYLGKAVNVDLLEVSGKAFEVATTHVNDIRSRLLEQMGIVLTSMADTVSRTTGGDMSARFLALAHAPLIALTQEYRQTWWPFGLRPILSMLARMTVELDNEKQRILVPGTNEALPLLSQFQGPGGWITPQMEPHWGKFFDPSSTEIKESVDATVAATTGHLISTKTGIEHVAGDYGVNSVETEIEEIEGDRTEAMEREDQIRREELAGLHGADETGAPGAIEAKKAKQGAAESGSGKQPPKVAAGGKRGAAPAKKKAKKGAGGQPAY